MSTAAELQQLWIQAGGDPTQAAQAAAVAMAESGGNANASLTNANGSIDRGYWQINSSHGSQSTFDPLGNARAAVAISANGTNWRPWCVAYTDKACGTKGGTFNPAALLGLAGASAAGSGTAAGGSPLDAIGNALSHIFDPFKRFIDVVVNNMFYASIVVAGGTLMAAGVYILTKETPAGSAVSTAKAGINAVTPNIKSPTRTSSSTHGHIPQEHPSTGPVIKGDEGTPRGVVKDVAA